MDSSVFGCKRLIPLVDVRASKTRMIFLFERLANDDQKIFNKNMDIYLTTFLLRMYHMYLYIHEYSFLKSEIKKRMNVLGAGWVK